MAFRTCSYLTLGALAAVSASASAADLGAGGRILRGGSVPVVAGGREVRILCWNIERGLQLAAIAAEISRQSPAIALLQEVDMHTRRTAGKNVAEELARAAKMNYVFGLEFEELGQGVSGRKAHQGQAVLTSLGTRSARVIQFRRQSTYWQPRWFMPNWALFQRRDGGRIALVVEVRTGSRSLVLYNVHLESRGAEELRRFQMEEVTADLRRHPPETAIVVAGDFNTRVPDSPAVKLLRAAGFRQTAGGRVTTRRGAALDWIFVRGPIAASDGKIHDDVHASDHFPLTTHLRWEDTRPSK